MNAGVLAQARRLYLHVMHGFPLKPEDISFMIEALEEAYDARREWVELTDAEREEATGWSVEHIESYLKEKNT